MPVFEIAKHSVDYPEALASMDAYVRGIQDAQYDEKVWLLEHPPVYTAGTSSKASNHIGLYNIPIYNTGRGGQHTYHGPGQRVAYVMIDLKKRSKDVRAYVRALEQLGIDVLKTLGVQASRSEEGVGLWVTQGASLSKIAAIGVRISRWVTSHGMSFNVNPDLDHYQGIIPCGIRSHGVTSLHALGVKITLEEFDDIFVQHFLKNPYLMGDQDV